jgi:hypothetical protein
MFFQEGLWIKLKPIDKNTFDGFWNAIVAPREQQDTRDNQTGSWRITFLTARFLCR